MDRKCATRSCSILGHRARAPRAGLTLLECLLAVVILAVAVLALSSATTVGHQHLDAGEELLTAMQEARNLVDEIASRPFDGTGGADRATWHVDDYDEFTEDVGDITDFTGAPSEATSLGRSVAITPTSHTVADLDGAVIPGKTVTITMFDDDAAVYELSRFLAEATP